MPLIEFQNVSKWFPHSTGSQLLRTHIAHWFGRVHHEPFYALRDVSFRLEDGESLAIVSVAMFGAGIFIFGKLKDGFYSRL
jgi:ABC-type polysaccharide/polyol phosphate transport system ATPase subunit